MSENDSDHSERPAPAGTDGAASAQSNRGGKIWQLPAAIRTELNQRLLDGQKGPRLLAWLNGLPEVQQVMKEHFGGAGLTLHNISRWRKGAYREWRAEELTREAVSAISKQGTALEGPALEGFTQNMARVLIARLGIELHRIEETEDHEERFKCLRDIMWGFIYLQRGRIESCRQQQEEARKAGFVLPPSELEKQVWLWASVPENKESLRRRLFTTAAEKQAAIDHILSEDGSYWAADEAYIEAHGGKLGAKLPEEFLQAMKAAKAKQAEEAEKEAGPVRIPERPQPPGPTR